MHWEAIYPSGRVRVSTKRRDGEFSEPRDTDTDVNGERDSDVAAKAKREGTISGSSSPSSSAATAANNLGFSSQSDLSEAVQETRVVRSISTALGWTFESPITATGLLTEPDEVEGLPQVAIGMF